MVTNDNNFAPSIFRSLCSFIGDCFGPQYFCSLIKILRCTTTTSNFTPWPQNKMARSYYGPINTPEIALTAHNWQNWKHTIFVNMWNLGHNNFDYAQHSKFCFNQINFQLNTIFPSQFCDFQNNKSPSIT